MADIQTDIERFAAAYNAHVTAIAEIRAAFQKLDAAVSELHPLRASVGSPPAGPRARAGATTVPRRPRGGKRSPDELVKLTERLHRFVVEHPGLRIEQINKELGTTTKDLALPMRKLLADGEVHSQGQKRSTTYFGGRARPAKRPKKR